MVVYMSPLYTLRYTLGGVYAPLYTLRYTLGGVYASLCTPYGIPWVVYMPPYVPSVVYSGR